MTSGQHAQSRILACDSASISFSADGQPSFSNEETGQNIKRAAQELRNSSLVAFPTETVYGLGGSALPDSTAIPKIYSTKGRPSDNPLIVHVASRSQLDKLVHPAHRNSLPRCYESLIAKFWPGPLTLLVPTIPGELVSHRVTAGLTTVGVRMPAHPVARALIATADVPVAAPSANTSGRPSPTTAQHVQDDLRGKPDLAYILDGGSCQVGLESTVVSALPHMQDDHIAAEHMSNGHLCKETLRILRLGGVSPEELQRCLQDAGLSERVDLQIATPHSSSSSSSAKPDDPEQPQPDFVPSTPGMKYKHYSPTARVVLLRQSDKEHAEAVETVLESFSGKKLGLLYLESSLLTERLQNETSYTARVSLGSACDYATQAQRLFSGLRDIDAAGVDVILVECVKEEGLGRTVMERLGKAAGNVQPLDVRV
ncbi:hypothetical protein EMMF5_001875 [Cystobasidiomycetes sp. EMM_F5]